MSVTEIQVGELSDREKVTILRRRYDISQSDVCRLTGMSTPHMSGWERGRRELSADHVANIWRALNAIISNMRSSSAA